MSITGIGEVADLATTVVNKIWPDKTQEEQQQIAYAVAVVQGQLDTNKAEAASQSVFVAGWRPFIGWVCGSGCAWNWVGLPVANFLTTLFGHPLNLHAADLSEMMPLLIGMLGLGGMRTYEKLNGVANGH